MKDRRVDSWVMIVWAYSCWHDSVGFVIASLSLTFSVADLCGCLDFGGFRAVARNSCSGIPPPQRESSTLPAITTFVLRLRGIQCVIHSNLQATKIRIKRMADKRRCDAPSYQINEKVWLSSKFLPLRLSQNKFKPRYYGPFLILQKINPVLVCLRLPQTWKIHPVFHASQLKPYVPDPFHRQYSCPPPQLVDDVPEYEVQEICDSRFSGGRLQFLIHWKGYPMSKCSWEDTSSVHAPLLVRRFFRLLPHKPGASGGTYCLPLGPLWGPQSVFQVTGPDDGLFSGHALFPLPRQGRRPRIECRSSPRTMRGTGVVAWCRAAPPRSFHLPGAPF
ncbi:hypothetical protein NDU88_007846 [Pleurodeles waltl]|uniref:Chromo domain-containing protein n=1 Tax=Pleurodeles waltl TaxID=8319 RepID=A0AAV7RU06_PLEWA|nr:hypothetical protein NDU88_007846 [Pleurodeles waltl]